MSGYEVDCPHCGKNLMKQDASGNIHLLTRLATFTIKGEAQGKCPQCRKKVAIPVRLAPTMRHLIANP